MDFWDRITGSDMTKEFKSFEVRVKSLPVAYEEAWEKIKTNLWEYSDFSGRNLMPIFKGVVELLEERAADGQRVEMIFGDDIKGFCLELVGEDGANTFRDKWRRQLNDKIAKKLGQ